MKKILFVASVSGHIKAFHLPYLKWFKENGYETHIACNGQEDLPYVDKHWQVDFERNPFKINNVKSYFQLKKIIDRENFVLINCNTPIGSVITRLATVEARKKGTKLIYTAHGFHFYKGASLKNWLLFYPVEKYLTKHTDAIITINTEDYNRIKEKGSKKCKYFLVNGVGVDGKNFYPVSSAAKEHIKKELKFPQNKLMFIYSGRLDQDKNHIFVINAVNKNRELFSNISILFAGMGSLEFKLRKKVEDCKLESIIKFIGYRTDINKVYRASDFGLSSSVREGLPINVVEEMLCGLPVVATKERGHNEIIDDKENGFLFTIDSEKEFIDIVKTINNRAFDYNQMSNRAIVKAQKFELSKSKEAITSIYKQFL